MKKMVINSITCKHSTNLPGDDDVFLLAQVDGGPPIRYPINGTLQMNDKDKVDLPAGGEDEKPTFYYEHSLSLTVWDHDGPANFLNEADFLGSKAFLTSDSSDEYDVWGVDSSEYSLDIDITDASAGEGADGQTIPSNLQSAAADAVLAWAQTDDGKKALKEDDPEKLNSLLAEGFADEIFNEVIEIVRSIPLIKAVSLGMMGQVEVFVGIDGAFGVAMDLPNFPDEYAIFAGGGIVEGVDAGIQGTLALGFWFQETTDIGGFYVGAEVDIDDGLGITAAAWAGRGDKDNFKTEEGVNLKFAKVVFLGIDVGIDDGVEADELYCLAGHVEDYPSFQPGPYTNLAIITEVKCDDQHSNDGFHDDVHFYWTVDGGSQKYRYPIWNTFEMDQDSDDSISSGAVVKFEEEFKVELHVEDGVGDTKKFTHTFHLDEFDGVGDDHKETYEDGGTKYHITAKLLVKG